MADRQNELTSGERRRIGQPDREPSDTADTAALRAEIRDTRERMGDTIEAIGEKLNPSHLKQQVKHDIREATIGRVETMAHTAADRVNDTRRTITDTIRENPIPATMVGIGLGWLFWNGRRETNGHDREFYGGSGYDRFDASRGYAEQEGGYAGSAYGTPRGGYAQGYAGGQQHEGVTDRVRHGAEHARERAHDVKESVRERAQDLGETVSEKAGDLADRAQDTFERVSHGAHRAANTVSYEARRRAHRVEDRFYESPLAIGALTLAVGMAAGMAVPATRREERLMGQARDQFVDKAKHVAEDTKEKVQHVAERVVDEAKATAKESAREEGLTR